ncbi:MAG: hypothetical protein JJ899_01740 [Alphaproteobacteria bacterium]|nr:hypothetical protein [Alphaproteobacteria bacterium]
MSDPYQALCAKCRIPIEGPENASPQDIFSCPKCGTQDRLEVIEKEIAEFTEEAIAQRMSDVLKKATKGSKNLTFNERPRAKKNFRFIVDLSGSQSFD